MNHGLYTSPALVDISRERYRQISAEGWSFDHDDDHRDGALARAAAAYALNSSSAIVDVSRGPSKKDHVVVSGRTFWPWDWKWWKPKDRRSDLVRAGALIIAEIERLDRASSRSPAHRQGEAP